MAVGELKALKELQELREMSGWSDEHWETRLALHNKKYTKVTKQESQGKQPGAAAAPRQQRQLFDWDGLCLKPNPYREHDDLKSTKDACNEVWGEYFEKELVWGPDRPSGGMTSIEGSNYPFKRYKGLPMARRSRTSAWSKSKRE